MRIYKVYGSGHYARGMAIVAASNRHEAVKVLENAKLSGWDNDWGLDFDSARAIRGANIPGKARVICEVSYIE